MAHNSTGWSGGKLLLMAAVGDPAAVAGALVHIRAIFQNQGRCHVVLHRLSAVAKAGASQDNTVRPYIVLSRGKPIHCTAAAPRSRRGEGNANHH